MPSIFTAPQLARLAAAPVGHLATADAAGRPHIVPFCFACDGDGRRIYSPLDAKPKRGSSLTALRRVRNILANPQVSVLIDHYEDDWRNLWYLLIQARAELLSPDHPSPGVPSPDPPLDLSPDDEHAAAIALLRAKYPQYRAMPIDANPVIKITPQRATAWNGSNTPAPATA